MSIAFVTGAAIRVGRSIALALAREGYDLILHANANRDALEEVAAAVREMGREAFLVAADLAEPLEVERLAEGVAAMHPRIDLLVNNAGIYEKRAYEQVDRDAWRRMQAINLDAPYFLTQGLLPALRAADAPSVINITDIGGERPLPGYSHYSVSKAGLLMLTRALAVELAPKIRVNAVSPGTVIFPEELDPTAREALIRRIPMNREGSGEDVGLAVVYLARHAPYVTGQVINVDGGRSAEL